MIDNRAPIQDFLTRLLTAPERDLPAIAAAGLTPDSVWSVSAPVEQLTGPEAILDRLILPLRRSLSHARRRDEIFIGGSNRRDYGGEWLSSVTHYVGNYGAGLFGLPGAVDILTFLRSGEFYRIDAEGRIAEAKIILDIPDLARQIGRNPFPEMLGAEMLFPGPATHDGVLPGGRDRGSDSLDIVEGMFADLHAFDPSTFSSAKQTGAAGYWADDMMWYGPGGIGSNYRWEGFVKDHRESFLRAFPDRAGGNHYCRIGDGDYAAASGWPSMTMTHQGDYLGVPASGKALTLRVMDFYRIARVEGRRGQIAENWVFLDYVDLMRQMGVDVIAQAHMTAPRRGIAS